MHVNVETLTYCVCDCCLQLVIASHTDMYVVTKKSSLFTEYNQLFSQVTIMFSIERG